MEVLIALLSPILFMPTITGYMATSHGRSFWRWFGIGCVLPYFSLLLITCVVYRDQRRARPTKSDISNPDLP
ncbi:hypothetical protein ACW9KT_18720 [Hymenobacter sp. HD11105]